MDKIDIYSDDHIPPGYCVAVSHDKAIVYAGPIAKIPHLLPGTGLMINPEDYERIKKDLEQPQ
jgi:hypothetical protein